MGQCLKLAKTDLYRETTKNTTFPKNVKADIDGDGKVDADAAVAIGAPLRSAFVALVAVVIGSFFL